MSGSASTKLDSAARGVKTVVQNTEGNNTGFSSGGWPQSTQVTAHASFADEKRPSDWQLVE